MNNITNSQPSVTFTLQNPMPAECCLMCTDPLENNVIGHDNCHFHLDCLAKWLRITPSCPSCTLKADNVGNTVFGHQSIKVTIIQTAQTFNFKGKLIQVCISVIPQAIKYGLSVAIVGAGYYFYRT